MAIHTSSVATLILGAGPAGLATAGCLVQAGLPFEILEQTDTVGSAWRSHYERLHLHTVKHHSALPGLPYPPDYPLYPSRQQVVDYLAAYAERFGIKPHFDETVTAVRRAPGGGYEVDSTSRRWVAMHVVVATGLNREPLRPEWPGQAEFRGRIVHSRDYRNGEPFRGQRVLVIGLGNTGGEIGLDLLEHGAFPSISVRSPINVVPRDFLGRPTQESGVRFRFLPRAARDAMGRLMSRATFGDLSAYGLGKPSVGPITSIEVHRRVPLIDVGMVARIKDGSMPVVPEVVRFTATGVAFRDGRTADFDAVVLATGYRTGLGAIIQIEGLLDEAGYPRAMHDPVRAPGLFFIGFARTATGILREIGLEARRIARAIRMIPSRGL